MKTLTFLFVICALAACRNKMRTRDDWVSKYETPATEEARSALDQAIDQLFPPEMEMSRGMEAEEGASGFLTRSKYEQTDFQQLPLLDFDWKKFMENPREEQVDACIRPATDKMLFAGRRDGKLVMFLGIKQVDGQWIVASFGNSDEESFARQYAGLQDLFERADGNKVEFIYYYSYCMLMYKEDGRTYFTYNPSNPHPKTKALLAEDALTAGKLMENGEQFLKGDNEL